MTPSPQLNIALAQLSLKDKSPCQYNILLRRAWAQLLHRNIPEHLSNYHVTLTFPTVINKYEATRLIHVFLCRLRRPLHCSLAALGILVTTTASQHAHLLVCPVHEDTSLPITVDDLSDIIRRQWRRFHGRDRLEVQTELIFYPAGLCRYLCSAKNLNLDDAHIIWHNAALLERLRNWRPGASSLAA